MDLSQEVAVEPLFDGPDICETQLRTNVSHSVTRWQLRFLDQIPYAKKLSISKYPTEFLAQIVDQAPSAMISGNKSVDPQSG